MSNPLGPIEIHCDAPPYPVVRAGHRIGLHSPEDVRWCRLSHFLKQPEGWREVLSLQAWKQLLGMGGPCRGNCTCGQKLPVLEKYTFTFRNGGEASYLIAQCGRCQTVFWEEA